MFGQALAQWRAMIDHFTVSQIHIWMFLPLGPDNESFHNLHLPVPNNTSKLGIHFACIQFNILISATFSM